MRIEAVPDGKTGYSGIVFGFGCGIVSILAAVVLIGVADNATVVAIAVVADSATVVVVVVVVASVAVAAVVVADVMAGVGIAFVGAADVGTAVDFLAWNAQLNDVRPALQRLPDVDRVPDH